VFALPASVVERVTFPRPADWVLPGGIIALLLVLQLAGPRVMLVLRYERAAVLAGDAWRLLTGHLVHADGAHLAWNVAGVVLVWFLFAHEYSRRGWLLILFTSTAAIDLGFLVLQPGLEWYVGFSGVLHGCMAAGLVAWLRREPDWLTAVVAALFAAKLIWEHLVGPLPFTSASLSVPVVYQAHSYGAVGGVLAALWLLRGRRSAEASL
jgi:rhomboid family GlyGly-CTERM serine protease